MRLQFLILLFCLPFIVSAQPRGYEYIDVVYLTGGKELVGTVVEYEYEKKVSIVVENGDLKELDWKDVRRVNFRLDKGRVRDIALPNKAQNRNDDSDDEPSRDQETAFRPSRKFMHQVTGSVNLGQSSISRFGSPATTIGGAFAYHVVRDVKFLKVGAGIDVSLMSHARDESVFSATGFAEYALLNKRKHLRPIIRFEAGPAFPSIGTDDGNSIIKRQIGVLLHPSIGLAFEPRKGQWGGLVFDLGYRFLDSSFTVLTPSLDELQRTVNYRRLVIRGGLRF